MGGLSCFSVIAEPSPVGCGRGGRGSASVEGADDPMRSGIRDDVPAGGAVAGAAAAAEGAAAEEEEEAPAGAFGEDEEAEGEGEDEEEESADKDEEEDAA